MDRRMAFGPRSTQWPLLAGVSARLSSIALCAVLLCSAGCGIQANRHNMVGSQAFQQGQYNVAINEFQQALRTNAYSADAYYNLGASYAAMGKQGQNQDYLNQAEQLYRQAISLDGAHVEAHRGLAALLIETNREQHAFDLMEQWRQRQPGSTDPIVETARLYQEYGDTRRATDLLADALRINPSDVRSLRAMGHLREREGQTHLALDNYMRALQADPGQTDVAQRVTALQTQMASQPVPPTWQQPVRYGARDPFLSR